MKLFFILAPFFVLFLFFPNKALASDIVINEVSPATSSEWVELYNTNPDPVSLQNYIIDFGSDSQKKSFCDNDQISGNSYKLIILTAFWLKNEGDTVNLKNGTDIVDSISYGEGTSLQKPSDTQSLTRSPDGSSSWILTDIPTQQGEQVAFECPTPTFPPTSTPTLSPTQIPDSPTPTLVSGKTPTPIKTPTPTNTPTPPKRTPTPSPTATPALTPTQRVSSPVVQSSGTKQTPRFASSVLGAQKSLILTPTPQEENKDKKNTNLAPFFIISGGGVLLVCAILAYLKMGNKVHEN